MKKRANPKAISRRRFTRQVALAAGAGFAFGSVGVRSLKALGYRSPNERLNIAGIGAGGQAFNDLRHCESENIVALADVDRKRGQAGFNRWGKATRYEDFRRMLDKEHKNIDGVVIAIPDHMHATAALCCMQLGLHVYLEKPLTRTAWEARLLTRAAQQCNVATQMGNQGYSHDATRVACEIIWSGEIGEVREVHAWAGAAGWPQGMMKIPPPTPVPETLNWDLWLGGAQSRPFTAGDEQYRAFIGEKFAKEDFGFYLPSRWRAFPDFGSSLIGDWGIHILGPANWALQLAPEYLLSVECTQKDSPVTLTFPNALTLRYEFAARPGALPPVTVYWHHHPNGDAYLPPGMTAAEARKIPGTGPQVGPIDKPGAGSGSGYNCIFAGSKGYLGTSGRGEGVGLLPGSRWAEYKLPAPSLSRSPGASEGDNHAAHLRDWMRACKGGATACSNFGIGGKYTEWLILGAAAVHGDGKLLWDDQKGAFTNSSEANHRVTPKFRKGWEINL
jgi:predicted dehydrogenase